MRGSDPLSNLLRFGVLLFLQVFIFRQIGLAFTGTDYLAIIVTPLFIALLPLRTPRPLVVVFACCIGLGTDLFYETLGVHMSAAVFTGYVRRFVLRSVAPQDGYKIKASPTGRALGFTWWMKYVALVLASFLIWYFSMEAFSPVFWRDIVWKTSVSLPVSWVVCMVLVALFRPRV